MTTHNDPYIDIRPYNDEEIPAAIDRLINDAEFIDAILQHRFSNHAPWFKAVMSPIVKVYLKFKWAKLDSVETIQLEVKKYLEQTLDATTKGVTYKGLDKLDKNTSYLSCLTIVISRWILHWLTTACMRTITELCESPSVITYLRSHVRQS
ncbi:hypothetical protein JCM19239_4981 [Vibrio variabilis]|uniref:Uncharacterized protein n=1 Tax=Vibrio variabilis TaxID=990271 RepID=A0ABQ0JBK5_9VIBR|nr:hypothetical protein JCM19239_4981 [Vibrio variabilis]